MHDHAPLRTVLSMLIPAALMTAVLWLLWGADLTDAVFAALKLVVMR